jgi:small acid-soluble spore protein I (minor)
LNIDIRKNIIDNFKESSLEDLRTSIDEAVSEKEEITLPGLGVLFEILWNNADGKEDILNSIISGIKKEKV